MMIKTNVRAGGIDGQHNETLAVRSDVNAGGQEAHHNETLAVRSDAESLGALDSETLGMVLDCLALRVESLILVTHP